MRLELGPDAIEIGRIAFDDGVWVSDIHRRETDPVDLLGLADDDGADLLLDH